MVQYQQASWTHLYPKNRLAGAVVRCAVPRRESGIQANGAGVKTWPAGQSISESADAARKRLKVPIPYNKRDTSAYRLRGLAPGVYPRQSLP